MTSREKCHPEQSEGSVNTKRMHTRGCRQILHFVQNDKGKGRSSDELMRAYPNNDKGKGEVSKKRKIKIAIYCDFFLYINYHLYIFNILKTY